MSEVADADTARPGFGKSAAIAVSSQLVVNLAGGIASVLVARLLGPSGKGLSAVVLFSAMAVGTFAACGMELWVAREIGRAGLDRRIAQVSARHIRWAVPAVVVVGAGVAAVLRSSSLLSLTEIGLAVALTIGWAVYLIELAYPLGTRHMHRYVIANSVSVSLYIVPVMLLLATGTRSLALVLAAATVGRWIPIAAMRLWRRHASRAGARLDRTQVRTAYRHALRFGLLGALGEMLELAIARVDLLLVAVLLDLEHAGYYIAASTLTEFLWVAPNAIADVLVPHAAAPEAEGARSAQAIRVTVTLLVAAAALVSATAFVTIPFLYGSEFDTAIAAVPPLAAAAVVLGAWKLVGADLVACGHPRARVTSGVAGVIAMLVADLALVPLLGIVGAALGSLVGYVVATAVALGVWRTLPGRRGEVLFRPTRSDFAMMRVALATWRGRAPVAGDLDVETRSGAGARP
jgi:O-antigen/teichoic acid export membrane protein